MWQAVKERSQQRRAAKAVAAAASAPQDGAGCDEEEVVKPLDCLSMERAELPAEDSQLCEEAQNKARGCLRCKVGWGVDSCSRLLLPPTWTGQQDLSFFLPGRVGHPGACHRIATIGCKDSQPGAKTTRALLAVTNSAQARQKTQLPPASDDYNLFVAWLVNKVCLAAFLILYIVGALLIVQMRAVGYPFHARDGLLLHSELSSCKVPGVLPGLADPCPAST